jgi:anthranilate synthase component 1
MPCGKTPRIGSMSLQQRLANRPRPGSPRLISARSRSRLREFSAEEFYAAVERSKRYIHDGDVFQVVISQRFDHEITAEPIDVYRVLRTLNPSPYMYLLSLARSRTESRTGSSGRALRPS